jgi:arsenical pump membrane protein
MAMGTSVPALLLAAIVVAGMLIRPWGSREWQWAAGGVIALLIARIEAPAAAWSAIAGGWNIYTFLAGIAILAEIARAEGVFDALALRARAAARGSRKRLLFLVYAAGVAVTALLSNDTTALVLTPAVFAALEASGAEPLPYLYACAFVANAASFLLPFSNPANLVTFGSRLPPLGSWVSVFGLAAVASTAVTYFALTLVFRARLRKPMGSLPRIAALSARTRLATLTVGCAALGMIVAASAGWNIGLATFALALLATSVVATADRGTVRTVALRLPWEILPLVASLFVVVDALDRSGALLGARALLLQAASTGPLAGGLLTALATAAASGLVNNLPVAMATAVAQGTAPAGHVLHAAVVGIDVGPNLCATGSLSTLLWLIAVRREGLDISAGSFFRIGLRAGLPALLIAGLLIR